LDTYVAVRPRPARRATQDRAILGAGRNDLDIAVAFGAQDHATPAVFFLGCDLGRRRRVIDYGDVAVFFLPRLGAGDVLDGYDVATLTNHLQTAVAAVRNQAHVTVAAGLGSRRLRAQVLAAAFAGLLAALRLGNDLLADLDLLGIRVQAEAKDVFVMGRRARLGSWRIMRLGPGRFADGQIGVTAHAAPARQFFNVLRAKPPGAAVGKGPHLAPLRQLTQIFGHHTQNTGGLF